MSILTRIRLNKEQAYQIPDSYAWHQYLWQAFPDRPDEERSFLFRVDETSINVTVLMLSVHEPTVQPLGFWESKTVGDAFLSHQTYSFDLRVNPTVRDHKTRRRYGIVHEDMLQQWMIRKSELSGFQTDIAELAITAPRKEFFYKQGDGKSSQRGMHISVDFKGVLTVTNREAFIQAFQMGIGSAKAFGFGLLMLQPLS